MANPDHLNALLQGVDHWNAWRYQTGPQGGILQGLDLSGASLTNQDLARADLNQVNLVGADLTEANLKGATLREADLTEANFDKADLTRVDLSDAILVDADLSTTKGLLPGSLAGADLTGAQLPESLSKLEEMSRIDELSKSTGALFVSMMAACAYSWLTIGSTTDLELVLKSGASKLPIIDTDIPIVGFYFVAPFVLLGIFFYFHLYLQRLWEALAQLPSVFPDGMTVDRKTYTWLISDLIRAYLKRLEGRDEPLFWLQKKLSIFLAYVLAPLTLWLFWVRYLVRHEWSGTLIHIVALSTGVGSALAFYHLAKITMRKDRQGVIKWSKPFRHPGRILYQGAIASVVGLGLWQVSKSGIEHPHSRPVGPFRDYAELEQKDVSQKPENWTGKAAEYQFVKGAQMGGIDLVSANLTATFLANADLTKADLSGADLTKADLTNADLTKADLSGADLTKADLTKAKLNGADLNGAILNGAKLNGANLTEADLTEADLTEADLNGADLVDANLNEAILNGANLRGTNLSGTHLRGGHLSWVDLRGVDLSGFDLRGANLSGAKLNRTDLRGAKLRGAYLREAKLRGAKLSGRGGRFEITANLSGVDLVEADLHGADLVYANLRGANLGGADLTNADLRGANFSGAHLTWANLGGADLRGVNLSGVDLSGVDLNRTDLRGVNLSGAKLSEAKLSGANLAKANLRGAHLNVAFDLTMAQLQSSNFDQTTQVPEEFAAEASKWLKAKRNKAAVNSKK